MKIKNIYIVLAFFLFIFFCFIKIERVKYNITVISYENEKIEFIASKAYEDFFLIKNIPLNDAALKKSIEIFIKQKYSNVKQEKSIEFYKYTWLGTDYFLDNEEHEGGPTSYIFLSNYDRENIANFFISKCKKDTTKLVGRFHFYGNGGLEKGKSEIDTLIYYCK